ncbi:MAG: acyl-CoA thioesterase [Gemmobacter sp.]
MSYTRVIPIEFNHCDPAGIVFYPRYFEMTNSVVENFFAEAVGYPFRRISMDEGCGVPTVRIGIDFRAPSRLGDLVAFTLDVVRLGTRSVTFRIAGRGDDGIRLEGRFTLVWVGRDGKAAAWPEAIRARLIEHLVEDAA